MTFDSQILDLATRLVQESEAGDSAAVEIFIDSLQPLLAKRARLLEVNSATKDVNVKAFHATPEEAVVSPPPHALDVQLEATKEQVTEKIKNFVYNKRNAINESNKREFLKMELDSCARVDAKEVNRDIQMKLDMVHNDDGPLARSTIRIPAPEAANLSNNSLRDVEERVENLEKHMRVIHDPAVKLSLLERIKVLETTITNLEAKYPAWAYVHFNLPNRESDSPEALKALGESVWTISSKNQQGDISTRNVVQSGEPDLTRVKKANQPVKEGAAVADIADADSINK